MAKIEGEVACAACGALLRVTLTKTRVGDPAPAAEYEVTGESVAISKGGLFVAPEPETGPQGDAGEEGGHDAT